jgi:putative endonuclease
VTKLRLFAGAGDTRLVPGAPRTSFSVAAYSVYVLRCADDTLYTGIARDVKARIRMHELGRGARYTRARGPFELCAVRRCRSKGEALRLEIAIKRLSRAEKDALIVGRRLSAFARRLAGRAGASAPAATNPPKRAWV